MLSLPLIRDWCINVSAGYFGIATLNKHNTLTFATFLLYSVLYLFIADLIQKHVSR